jgi:NADPH-dependent 7-cyano-7-deazaguanine reductase QueF-like protein
LAFTGTYEDVILTLNPANPEASLGSATATDATGAVTVTSTDGPVVSDGCNRSKTRTFTATDVCGNTTSTSRTVRWTEDITAPTVTKGNIASCYKTVADAENAAKAATTYSDNCSTNEQLNVSVHTEGTCSASITVTVSDAANNSSSVTYTTKIDNTAPVLSSYPEGMHLSCTSVIFPLTITASDNCDGTVNVILNETNTKGGDPTQSSYFNYTVTRTWSASDACGNTVAHTQIITIEDKTPPQLNCPGNMTVSTEAGLCYADVTFNVNALEPCGMVNTSYYLYYGTDEEQQVGSQWRFDAGSYSVTVVSTDVSGNSSRCTIALTVRDTEKPTVVTKNIIVQLNAAGNATISNSEVNDGSSDNCTPQANLIFETNIKSFSCSDIGSPVTVTLKVTDASGNTATATATVTVADNIPPTVNTKNATIYLNASGQAMLTVAHVNNTSTDNCSIPSNGYQLSKTNFDCSNAGPNTVTLKVTDVNGNTATATATVTVVDNTPPTVNTKNATIYLNASGQAMLTVAHVNNTSTDNCSIPSNGYQLSKTSFDCSNAGPNTVTLKVTDVNGNTAMATATVTVVDNTSPTVNTKSATIYLNASGQATLTVAQVNNTSTDNCPIPSNGYQLSKTSFDCSNAGPNTVTLKVTDASGNTATATATVTVVDNTPPTVNTKSATIYLNASGQAMLTVAHVNNTSTDNCSIPSNGYQLSKTNFDCSNAGPNTVTLKVTDASGNTATATATVTVVDNTPPTVNTKNATIYLNASGQAMLTVAHVNNTSTDNCPIPSNGYMLSKTSFDCSNAGPNTVTLKVTDANGNTATATATVTVVDNTSPTVNTKSATIYLNASGQTTLTVAQVNNTSTDNCPIPSNGYMLSKTSFDCSNAGPNTVTLKVTDASGNTATATATVTVVDNIPPTVNTKSATIYLNASGQATLTVAHVNNTSTDNCSIPSNGYQLSKTSFDCSNAGPNTVTLKVTDVNGNTTTATATVTVVDNTPPVINNASTSTCILSPANHKMRDVSINYTLTDNCGPINTVLSVSSDEPISGTGDGDTAPDWEVIDNHNVKLRAERSGSGDGRVYTITITATDASGNTSTSSVEVRVTHNITSPQSGKSFKVGSTVSLEGEFWDKQGNNHSATWLIDDNTTVKGTVTEPTATKNGKVTGSYKFTAPGVYKLQMNTKDQNNVVSYANTSGDLEAIIVIYDPNGGYTYGGGYFNSPAGAVTSNASATGKASYGFSVNYFKGATYPKGETQFDFKVGEFEFNALNFEYMAIAGAKAQMKGTGKIIGGQSGINFILTVTDGQLDGTGIDRIRMKIYNKNTMEVYYDNQPGASDVANPTIPVQENSTVVISGTNSNLTQSNQVTTKVEQEVAPVADGLEVKVMPNPSSTNFRIVVNSNDLKVACEITCNRYAW